MPRRSVKKKLPLRAHTWERFTAIYSTRTDELVAQMMSWTVDEVRDYARSLALRKDKEVFRGKGSPRWTQRERNFLRINYPKMTATQIALRLGRSVWAVKLQASRMRIYKRKLKSARNTTDRWSTFREDYNNLAEGKTS